MSCSFNQIWHYEQARVFALFAQPPQTESRSNETILVQTHLFHGRKNTEATSETGQKCFSLVSHTKSIPFHITLVKRALTDISPGQLLHKVCFTCKHTSMHKKTTHAHHLVPLSFPLLSLPLVPFNIPRRVKVFWVALNSAAPIMPVHITTVLTCSDCSHRRDVLLWYSAVIDRGQRASVIESSCDSHSNWQLCQYKTCVSRQRDTGS